MIENLFTLTEYLSSNKLFYALRNILNLIFCLSIASFFYKLFWGNYEFYQIDEYSSLINFFINGNYIIPCSIYVIIFILTGAPAFIIFNSNTISITKKGVQITAGSYSNLNKYFHSYFSIEKDANNLQMKLKSFISVNRKVLSKTFTFFFRFLITLIIYYFSQNNLNIFWFISLLLLIVLALLITYFLHQLLLIAPSVISFIEDKTDATKK